MITRMKHGILPSLLGIFLWISGGCAPDDHQGPSKRPETGRIAWITSGPLESNLVPNAITLVDFYADG